MLCCGTYEGHLIGWGLSTRPTGLCATLEIAQRVHEGKVTCLASAARQLSSGGADESARVFDLRGRRAVGSLQQHSGTVQCQAYVPPGRSLLTGGADGGIIVWRCSDWVSLLAMRGHKGGVSALAAHPSGRLALSLGRDLTLRLWDLTKGRQVHQQALPQGAGEGREALWSADGARFYVLFDSCVCVFSGGDGELLARLAPPPGRAVGALAATPRLNAMCLLRGAGGEALAVACEGQDVLLWDVARCSAAGAPCAVLPTGHDKRVRALAALAVPPAAASGSAGAGGGAAGAPAGGAGKRKKREEEEEDEEEEEEEETEEDGEEEDGDEDEDEDEEDEGAGQGGAGAGARPAPAPSGLARLSAESVHFSIAGAAASASAAAQPPLLLATFGGDGEARLWDGGALAAALARVGSGGAAAAAAAAAAARPGKKGKKGAAAAAPAEPAAQPPTPLVEVLAVQHLAVLKAAMGTRPTCAVGTAV